MGPSSVRTPSVSQFSQKLFHLGLGLFHLEYAILVINERNERKTIYIQGYIEGKSYQTLIAANKKPKIVRIIKLL